MMKTLLAACVSVLLLGGLAATAQAQATSQPTPRPGARMQGLMEKLDLTADQKAQIKAIREQAQKDAQAATDPAAKRKIHQEARQKIHTTVLTEAQRQRLAELRAEASADRKAGEPTTRPGRPGMRAFSQLGLTDAQKTQAKEIMDQARKDADAATDQPSKRRIMREGHEKVVKTVLTDDQRKKLAELRSEAGGDRKAGEPATGPAGPGLRGFAQLGLTDAQKAQAKEIMDQARKDAEAAADQPSKRRIMREGHEKVIKTVLTDDQRKKLEEQRAERRARRQAASQPAK